MTSKRRICIINIGPSRFFLHQTAKSLPSDFFDVQTVSGLVPNSRKLVSRILQDHFKSGKRVFGRVNESSDKITRHESLTGEFFWQIGSLVGKYRWSQELSKVFYAISLSCFDLLGIYILRNHKKESSGIYYVRSGCGNKSIPYAISLGFKVVVDHSTTHPLYDFAKSTINRIENLSHFSLEMRMLKDLDQSANIIVNSEFVLSTFRLAGDRRELKVLLPPIDSRFSEMLRGAHVESRQGIIYFGLASARKGIQGFAEVVKLLPSSLPVKVIGNWQPEMLGTRDSLSIQPNVEVRPHGDFEDLVKLLSSARYFLFLAQGEGSARTVGEALHAGLIVLTTKQAGMSFQEGAILDVSEMSSVGISKLILDLEQKNHLRESISNKAREYIARLEIHYLPNLIDYLNQK